MSSRAKVWSIGLVVATGLAGFLAAEEASRGLIIPVALLSMAIVALVAEATAWRSLAKGEAGPIIPSGARPADGIVDVVPMAGVASVVNPRAPQFRRFVGVLDEGVGSSRGGGLSPTNPALLGRAVLISVFVGRDGAAWSDREIAGAHDALEEAGRWIEREAVRHAAPLNVGLAEAYFVVGDDQDDLVEVAFAGEGDDVGPMEAHASTKALEGASRAAALLGFRNVADWLARINPRVEADVRAWLFHIRRAGRSLAIPASESDVTGVGLAICFSEEASFPEPLVGPGRVDPTTVAHELLHLFGASDKYGHPLDSFAPGSVTSRDVMRLDRKSLSRMTIDPLTAREIGWGPGSRGRQSTEIARRRPSAGRRRAGKF